MPILERFGLVSWICKDPAGDPLDEAAATRASSHEVMRMTPPIVSASEASNLPSGWYATEIAGRGVDLRVSAPQRSRAAVVIAILAILAGWKAFVQWSAVSTEGVTPWVGLTLFLSLLALWIAFGDEVWHLERNCLVHRVGIGRWYYSRNYQDADLEIIGRFNKWDKPYYRMYATVNGKQRFLIERGEQELLMLASFISFHTSWHVRPQPISPG